MRNDPPFPRRRGSRARMIGFAIVGAVTVGVAMAVDVALGSHGIALAQLPIIGLGAFALLTLNRTSADYGRALERERALRRAGAALVAAPDRDAVLTAGLAAVAELAGPSARGAITVSDGTSLLVKGETGPDPLRLPLRGREPQGMLAITSADELDDETRVALESFATELGLALEAAGQAALRARRDADAWYRSLIDNAADVITVVDPDGTIRYQTPSIHDVLGFLPEALKGTKVIDLIHPDDREWVMTHTAHALRRPGLAPGSSLVRWRHRDGSYRWVESVRANLIDDPAVRGYVVNSRDVTDRVRLEEQLTHRAFHDSLTGLANRALFVDRLEHALYAGNPQDERLAVLFVDLDDFKKVNDSLGHPTGDALLQACARRLTERLAAGDTAARLGGDEFAVLLETCPGPEAAAQMAQYLLDALAEPFELDGRRVSLTASAGIALVARREQPPAEEILRNADIALYRAKEGGTGRYRIYEDRMHEALLRRMELEAELRRAIAAQQFVLAYQPIVHIDGGAVAGAEALVRWHHPEKGMIPPAQFIPVAEQAGMIEVLGTWILREAVRQAAEWHATGVGGGRLWISVNLSVEQLANPALVGEVELALRDHGLPPELLVLELTESAVMRDVVAMTHRLDALKALGVRIAVDDFGEGHSSLAYLASLPLDLLKVPKTFVDQLDGGNVALVRAIVELSRSFGLRTIAEGIERGDQVGPLIELGCDLAQGYWFARPGSAAEIAAMAEPPGVATLALADAPARSPAGARARAQRPA